MYPVILLYLFALKIKVPVLDQENLLHHRTHGLAGNCADIAVVGNKSNPVDFRLKLFDECQSFLDVIRLFQYGDIVVLLNSSIGMLFASVKGVLANNVCRVEGTRPRE